MWRKLSKKWARIMPTYKILGGFLTWQTKGMKPLKFAGLKGLHNIKEVLNESN